MMKRDDLYEFTRRQLKRDKRNAKKIQHEADEVMRQYMEFWALFHEDNPDYTIEDASKLPDREVKRLIDKQAKENGQKPQSVANNRQLLDYGTAVFASILGYKLVKLIDGKLSTELKKTAQHGRETYQIRSNELSSKIIDEAFAGAKWSNRIWSSMDELRANLSKYMSRALLVGENPVQYNKELRKQFGVASYQADRILRTEGARVSSLQQVHDAKKNGSKYLEWVASPSACKYCLPLDGKRFPVEKFGDEPYVLPRHPNCRCAVYGVDSPTSENGEADFEDNSESAFNLPPNEEAALMQYIGSDSYVLNDELRRGNELSPDMQKFSDDLSAAISDMPKYHGTVSRSLKFEDEELFDEFATTIATNYLYKKKFISKGFMSTTTGIYDSNDSIRFIILNSKSGADVRKHNPGEQEILFDKGSEFDILKIELVAGKPTVTLREAKRGGR
ncbi:minor capsid protein [Pediococcus pentosaceus]|uniref:minor capsid protein n=1 Tax=Pediococcus pentosaceus TaxID=1255 RepID=UPI003982851B